MDSYGGIYFISKKLLSNLSYNLSRDAEVELGKIKSWLNWLN